MQCTAFAICGPLAVLCVRIGGAQCDSRVPFLKDTRGSRATSSSGKSSNRRVPPTFTAAGPSRKQILVSFPEKKAPAFDSHKLLTLVNDTLHGGRKSIMSALSVTEAYEGIAIATNTVAWQSDVDLVRNAVKRAFPNSPKVWVGLPTSTSYLKMIDVPLFVDRDMKVKVHRDDIKAAMEKSPLAQHFTLAGPARVAHDSGAATTATVYFNVWDTQSGAKAKALINRPFLFHGRQCKIMPARANPGSPLCIRCWRWGHTQNGCRAKAIRCP